MVKIRVLHYFYKINYIFVYRINYYFLIYIANINKKTMKKILLKKRKCLFTIISCLFIVIISCDSKQQVNVEKSSITALIQSQTNLSILKAALEKTNLLSMLDSSGTYTFFAPTNTAFQEYLSLNNYESINDVPTALLKEILLNHVISQVYHLNDLPANSYIKTLAHGNSSLSNTLSLYIDKTTGVILNGDAMIINSNIIANNGVLHIVDAVIVLPTLLTQVTSNPNLSTLSGKLTSPGQPNFIATLSGSESLTIFAPTNTAFTDLNTELAPGGTAGISTTNLTKILQYHITNGNILTDNFTEGQVITSLQTPQTFTVLLAGGYRLRDYGNRECTIIATNIQCTNGVIHELSKVMLPNFN